MEEVPPRAIMVRRQAGLLETPKMGASVGVESRMPVFSVVPGIVRIVAASHTASLQRGYRWTSRSRDEQAERRKGAALSPR